MKKILLISMPFGALGRPAMGISLLKACLAESGIDCDLYYASHTFAELIGFEDYIWLSCEMPYIAFAGDWSFTHTLYGPRPEVDKNYLSEVLRNTWQLDLSHINRLQRVRSLAPHFLDHCLARIPWNDYAVVGFTSTFEQNIASLALAKRVKEAHPDVLTVFGGANWEGEMGAELHQKFPFVDYVCSGKAEESFPALVGYILEGKALAHARNPVGGIMYRTNGQSVSTGAPQPIQDMDALPIPDYSDYFQALSQSTVGASILPVLLLETSRGCWWGSKSQCTFCGLNGANLTYRSKSAARVLDEIEFLVDQWRLELVEVVDNMLDMKYFNDLLPALAEAQSSLSIFFETKANLTRQQVRLLHEAGVDRIQPGIESLSDHVLQLMRKGTSALRNIQLLKWCKEYHIMVDWNILYGFPGETQDDYEAMLDLLPSIRFLTPPHSCGPVRLDRFSPYFNTPEEFGIVNVRPMAAYKYLYPFEEHSLARIAYSFDYDYAPEVDPTGYASQVIAYVDHWRCHPETGTLSSIARPDDTLVLLDTRSEAKQPEVVLSSLEKAAYEYCDSLRSNQAVVRHLQRRFPGTELSDKQVGRFLDSLVANRLMVTDGKHYLSLAIPMDAMRPGAGNGAIPWA